MGEILKQLFFLKNINRRNKRILSPGAQPASGR